jgi:GNAT superfamily N-acetyltransferase
MNITYNNTLSVEDFNDLRDTVDFGRVAETQVRKALERNDFLIVANDGDRPVGMARVMIDGFQALVMDVIVRPDYQGQGIGRALMERVNEYIASQVSHGEAILVNLLTDKSKINFYKKFGYDENEGMRRWIHGV